MLATLNAEQEQRAEVFASRCPSLTYLFQLCAGHHSPLATFELNILSSWALCSSFYVGRAPCCYTWPKVTSLGNWEIYMLSRHVAQVLSIESLHSKPRVNMTWDTYLESWSHIYGCLIIMMACSIVKLPHTISLHQIHTYCASILRSGG